MCSLMFTLNLIKILNELSVSNNSESTSFKLKNSMFTSKKFKLI